MIGARTTLIFLGSPPALVGLLLLAAYHDYKMLPDKDKYAPGTKIWLLFEVPIEIRAEEYERFLRNGGLLCLVVGTILLLLAPFFSN
jgi:hypothetical protein